MKILHVMPTFYPAHVYGGPIQSVYALCRHLARLGCQVRVLTTNGNGAAEVLDAPTNQEVELSDGVRVRYCARWMADSAAPRLLAGLPAYVRWADVVHLTAVYSFPVIPALLTASLMRKPVIWSPRGSLQPWSGRRRQALKSCWESACRLVAPERVVFHVTSEKEKQDCRAHFPELDAALISNGVEIPGVLATPRNNGCLRLLFMGRLHPVKGLENLLGACARLRMNWSLRIAGSGDPGYVQSLRRLIASLGIETRIRMEGKVDGEAKEDLFRNSDLLALPSYTENFGMAVGEALARGLPVIVSRSTPWQRVEEVGCGYWVDNDVSSLVAAIERISLQPLQKMGLAGRSWMEREFSWESRAAAMLQLYSRPWPQAPEHAARYPFQEGYRNMTN